MSNLHDRKGSPRRDFEYKYHMPPLFIALLWANPACVLGLFAGTGDWFVFLLLFWQLKMVTSRGLIWA